MTTPTNFGHALSVLQAKLIDKTTDINNDIAELTKKIAQSKVGNSKTHVNTQLNEINQDKEILKQLNEQAAQNKEFIEGLTKAISDYNKIAKLTVADGKNNKLNIAITLNQLIKRYPSLADDAAALADIVKRISKGLKSEEAIDKDQLETRAPVTYRTLQAYSRSFEEQNYYNRRYMASIIDPIFTELQKKGNDANHGNYFFLQAYLLTQCADVKFNLGSKDRPEFADPTPEQRAQLLCHGGRVLYKIDPNINNNLINSMMGVGGYLTNQVEDVKLDERATDFDFSSIKSEHLTLGSTHYLKSEQKGIAKHGTPHAEGKLKLPIGVWLQQPIYWLSTILPLHKVFSHNHWFGLNMAAFGENASNPDGSTGYVNITLRHHDNNILPTLMMTGDEGSSWGKTNVINGHTHSIKAHSAVLSPAGELKYDNPFYKYKAGDNRKVPTSKYNSVYTNVEPTDIIKLNIMQHLLKAIYQRSELTNIEDPTVRWDVLAHLLEPRVLNELSRIYGIAETANTLDNKNGRVILSLANDYIAHAIEAAKAHDKAALSKFTCADFLATEQPFNFDGKPRLISIRAAVTTIKDKAPKAVAKDPADSTNNTVKKPVWGLFKSKVAVKKTVELPTPQTLLSWMLPPTNNAYTEINEPVFTTPLVIKQVYELKNLCQNLYAATTPTLLDRVTITLGIKSNDLTKLNQVSEQAIASYNSYVCSGYQPDKLEMLQQAFEAVAKLTEQLSQSQQQAKTWVLFSTKKQTMLLKPFFEKFNTGHDTLLKLNQTEQQQAHYALPRSLR